MHGVANAGSNKIHILRTRGNYPRRYRQLKTVEDKTYLRKLLLALTG